MSRTSDQKRTGSADFYPTPAWCVDRLLDVVQLPSGRWLEPAVGDGAIIRAVDRHYPMGLIRWTAVDIRDVSYPGAIHGDFLDIDITPEPPTYMSGRYYDVVITNPPYNQALDFIKKSMTLGCFVVMLLRIDFLASAHRASFFAKNMPNVCVLPNRPSFTGRGTDATEYAWFVWDAVGCSRFGKITVLPLTTLKEMRS